MSSLTEKFKAALSVAQSKISKQKDPRDIVAEIHESFDSAAEKLLNEAKYVLSEDYNTEKGERLQKIGFTASKSAVEAEKILKKKKQSIEVSKRVTYFQKHYPHNKFITEDMVKDICTKYALLCASAERYIGDIPEKNLTEIEDFILRDEEKIKHKCMWLKWCDGGYAKECTKDENGAIYGHITVGMFSYSITKDPEGLEYHYEQPGFMICAPEKDFDTKKTTILSGYKLVNEDPIVLQPVPGGYLVVTKWGLEAEDSNI